MTTETLKNPSVPTITNPIGIDATIQAIQIKLGQLAWMEKSFGRAWSIPRIRDKKKILEPMLYQGSKEYYPAMPNDNLKAYCFWRVTGPRNAENFSPNLNTGGSYIFSDPVDLIVWCDLERIDAATDYIYKETLIREVLNVLNTHADAYVSRVWDDKVEDIFRGYSLEDVKRDLLMFPFTGFRIEMNLKYRFLCQA